MPTPLPAQLAYLAPTIQALEKFDPEELHEDNPTAMDAVESAVRVRVRGMTPDDARAAIEQDCAALEQWLKQPGLDASPGHYLFGALFGMTMWADFDEFAG